MPPGSYYEFTGAIATSLDQIIREPAQPEEAIIGCGERKILLQL